jgi:hypothetical protein
MPPRIDAPMISDREPLGPREVSALLEAGGAQIRAEAVALPDAVLRWRPAPGAWCVLEVIGHLIEAEERGFAGRVRRLVSDAGPVRFISWDQDEVARARRDHEQEPGRLLDDLARCREASLRLVAGLTPADLTRGGDHPTVGRLTVADLLHEWVHHDRNHLSQILAIVQARVWPHMGNAQRFSRP